MKANGYTQGRVKLQKKYRTILVGRFSETDLVGLVPRKSLENQTSGKYYFFSNFFCNYTLPFVSSGFIDISKPFLIIHNYYFFLSCLWTIYFFFTRKWSTWNKYVSLSGHNIAVHSTAQSTRPLPTLTGVTRIAVNVRVTFNQKIIFHIRDGEVHIIHVAPGNERTRLLSPAVGEQPSSYTPPPILTTLIIFRVLRCTVPIRNLLPSKRRIVSAFGRTGKICAVFTRF